MNNRANENAARIDKGTKATDSDNNTRQLIRRKSRIYDVCSQDRGTEGKKGKKSGKQARGEGLN
nr:hypothetical protein [uncultured Desulfobulbus sp.]